MYHFFSQVAILGTRENDKSIYASVRIAINVACVRIERLTLAMPMAMLPVHAQDEYEKGVRNLI